LAAVLVALAAGLVDDAPCGLVAGMVVEGAYGLVAGVVEVAGDVVPPPWL
jgi:hypothetical protein